MGNSSGDLYNKEKLLFMNQNLWEKERQSEINRIFGQNLRNDDKGKKAFNFEKQHNDFLERFEKENFEKKKKFETESKINRKIFGDDMYLKKYIENIQIKIRNESLNNSNSDFDNNISIDNGNGNGNGIQRKSSLNRLRLPNHRRNRSEDFNCRLWKKN
jgi:hypothetical protein